MPDGEFISFNCQSGCLREFYIEIYSIIYTHTYIYHLVIYLFIYYTIVYINLKSITLSYDLFSNLLLKSRYLETGYYDDKSNPAICSWSFVILLLSVIFISTWFSSNSEAFASEFLVSYVQHIRNAMFKSSNTHYWAL